MTLDLRQIRTQFLDFYCASKMVDATIDLGLFDSARGRRELMSRVGNYK